MKQIVAILYLQNSKLVFPLKTVQFFNKYGDKINYNYENYKHCISKYLLLSHTTSNLI